ncbi:MAG: UDP-glucose 4-epimerase GalE [Deltaproteobacteria bacterium]|nr:UDP-glucose 4-epimerase GalE [Deltaproteobacteria bacterium]
MSILITGGAGYIGSHMALELLDAGQEVVVLDDLSNGFRNLVDGRAGFVRGDIANISLVESVLKEHKITAVIHFAGSVVVPESVEDPLKYYRNNTAKSRVLIETCLAAGVKHFIFSSTGAVYGNHGLEPLDEDTPPQPVSPYGHSKLMTEQILRDVSAAHGMAHISLRYFNVAGADPGGRLGQAPLKATHLVKVACEAALGKREFLTIHGTDFHTPDGTGIRDYIHVTDLVNVHNLALEHLRGGGENLTLNCGYGRGYSVQEVVDAVKKVSGVNFRVKYADRRPGDAAVTVACTKRLTSLTGFSPRYDNLETIIAHALAWEAGYHAEELPVIRPGGNRH